ncbi:MAG: hypothetical protein V3T17_10860 [Pseudomonadales bacterium]
MSLTATQCTILMGPNVTVPLPATMTEAIQSIEVTHSDNQRSGFQIVFTVGRCGSALDYSLLKNPLLQTFNRVTILVVFNAISRMIMDGIITHVQLKPSSEPGASTLTVTGEDVGVLMDREEKIVEHSAQSDVIIVNKIIASYAQYNLVSEVIPAPVADAPSPTDRTPVQHGTDLDYLQTLAQRYGYVFYIATGPLFKVSTAYWGPPKRVGLPQRALAVNMGPGSNVASMHFKHNALAPSIVSSQVQDRSTHQVFPVTTFASTRAPLSRGAAVSVNPRQQQLAHAHGLNYQQALAQAQAQTDLSNDQVVTAEGEIDAARYGEVLQTRALVGVSGAGETYDGWYYVKRVSHTLRRGQYQQGFTLTRDGTGSTTAAVIP